MDNKTNTKGLFVRIIQKMYELMSEEIKITGFEVCKNITGKVRDRDFYNAIQELKSCGLVENYSYYEKEKGVIGYYIRLSDIGKEIVELSKFFSKRTLT